MLREPRLPRLVVVRTLPLGTVRSLRQVCGSLPWPHPSLGFPSSYVGKAKRLMPALAVCAMGAGDSPSGARKRGWHSSSPRHAIRLRRPTVASFSRVPADWHRHVPLHGHRGVDAVAARARRRVCGGARGASARSTRGLWAPWGRGGGHPGRCLLRSVRASLGCRCGRACRPVGASGSDPCSYGSA